VPKLGSLQAFCPSLGVAEDYSWSRFSAREVHKIALLDLRILNCDRNAGNILVVENEDDAGGMLSLVPIDHGYCAPEQLEISWYDWCWLDWPQCKEPLDPRDLAHVLNDVDPVKDAAEVLARTRSPESACLIRMAGMLLQTGIREGLSVFDVASLMVRQDVGKHETPSELERLHRRACEGGCDGACNGPEGNALHPVPRPAAKPVEQPAPLRPTPSAELHAAEPSSLVEGHVEGPERWGSAAADSVRLSPPGFWAERIDESEQSAHDIRLEAPVKWHENDAKESAQPARQLEYGPSFWASVQKQVSELVMRIKRP